MRRILEDTLLPVILDDRRLTPTNKLVYIGLRSYPKNTIVHNATVLKMPYETVRWSVRRLIELGWAYPFPHPKTGRDVIVPWMPLDVEVAVARQVEDRSGLVPQKGEWLMRLS